MTALVGASLLALGVALYVLHPLFAARSAPMGCAGDAGTAGRERTRALLVALRDLEHDRAAGKLDEEAYRELRSALAAEAIRQLDRDAGKGREEASAPAPRDVEAEIARLRSSLRKEGGE